jgi:vanillate O-demethylase monooxygenase subunit
MAYVRNAWYVAAWSVDIEDSKPFHMDILQEPIVIYRSDSGRLVALEDRCVHRMAALSLGRCEGDNLRCMYHGMKFSPEGKVIEIPGQDIIPDKAKVKSYPIVEKHSWLWVWMGDPERADEALIPPAVGLDDPNFILGHGSLDYEAEARLINDNLLDFSHLTYVHAASFGAGDAFAIDPPKITRLERGVRFSRWVTNTTGGNSQRSEDLIDNWASYDFLIPGILLMESAAFPLGTAEEMNFEAPDMEKSIGGRTFTSQAVTPTTAKGSRYSFSWGPHKDHGDEAMRDFLMKLGAMAFDEDKVMIEAQQKVIDATENPTILASTHDRGVTMFNRLVSKLAVEENQA